FKAIDALSSASVSAETLVVDGARIDSLGVSSRFTGSVGGTAADGAVGTASPMICATLTSYKVSVRRLLVSSLALTSSSGSLGRFTVDVSSMAVSLCLCECILQYCSLVGNPIVTLTHRRVGD